MDKYLSDIKRISRSNFIFIFTFLINIFLFIFIPVFIYSYIKGNTNLIVVIISISILILFTILLIFISRRNKLYFKEMYNYYVFKLNRDYSYEEIVSLIEDSDTFFEKDVYKYSESQTMFLLFKKFIYRILVLKLDKFDKKNYDKMKQELNRKYNKKIGYTERKVKGFGGWFCRVNIIYVKEESNELYNYMSKDAGFNLRKVEGTLNIAITPDKVIVPSIRSECFNTNKYRKTIEFIINILDIK